MNQPTIQSLSKEAQQAAQTLPPLDHNFVPPSLWEQAYRKHIRAADKKLPIIIDILRPDGSGLRIHRESLPETADYSQVNRFRIERIVKFLLWQIGGSHILIDGPDEWVNYLKELYSPNGEHAFDNTTIGQRVFENPIQFISASLASTTKPNFEAKAIGGHLKGNRIGFDLGGSDRKCAAVIDGKVVFSEEVAWAPYFESDPNYHIEGIRDSITRAAKHLPKIDAIGGSAAGIYIDNQPRIASLFRGLSDDDFNNAIKPFFKNLTAEWDAPTVIVNDGDVTALAGAMSAGAGNFLGIAMGTSLACGYVDANLHISGALNELAFVPVDYRTDAPADEWSGDNGCGVQYFSQQAVGRLAQAAGIQFSADVALPQQLVQVQALAQQGDQRGLDIFGTIGSYLAHSLAQFSQHYAMQHVLLLGRVMSGSGGDIIMQAAKETLQRTYPQLAKYIQLSTPDEKMRRHGQAIAAASLPQTGATTNA